VLDRASGILPFLYHFSFYESGKVSNGSSAKPMSNRWNMALANGGYRLPEITKDYPKHCLPEAVFFGFCG
jgi:hypothetical protein